MKTAVKVFLILSIISYSFLALFAVIFLLVGMGTLVAAGTEGIALIIIAIVYAMMAAPGLVLSIIALKKLSAAKCSADFSIGWKIVVLLLVNLISGILLLCMQDNDYLTDEERAQRTYEEAQKAKLEENVASKDNFDELLKLKKLFDEGAITEEEYNNMKKQLLRL